MAREVVHIEGLAEAMAVFRKLPAEIIGKAGGPIKFGLKAAANVFIAEARTNLQKIIDEPNIGGANRSTGLLQKNIVGTRGKPPPGKNGEVFRVRIKNKRYPDVEGAKPVTTVQVGRLLETGTEKRKAMAWLRPAFDAKKHEAVRTFVFEVQKRSLAALKRLERQERVRK